MIKEGEDIADATGSSQDLARKIRKKNQSKGDKHDPTMSHRRGYVQRHG